MMKVTTVSHHVADDRMERMMNIARLIGWGEEVLRVWSWKDNAYLYPLTIGGTAVVSVLYAMDAAGLYLGFVSDLCRMLPLYDMGFCWVSVAAVMMLASFGLKTLKKK